MVNCPNCGIENPDSRLFCAVCGTQLREPEPIPPEPPPPPVSTTGSLLPDWLTMPATSASNPASESKKSALPGWLQGADLEGPSTPTTPAPPPPVVLPPGDSTSLEARTRVTLPPSATPSRDERRPDSRAPGLRASSGKSEAWDEQLDFSDLPERDTDELPPQVSDKDDPAPDERPMGAVETEGLLAGVSGAIPIEPCIRLSRRFRIPFTAVTE